MTLNDLEPLKKRFLVNFSQFLDAAHISTLNCDEMAGDRPEYLNSFPVFCSDIEFKKRRRSTACIRKFLHYANQKLNAKGLGRLVEQWKHCSKLQGDHVEQERLLNCDQSNVLVARIIFFCIPLKAFSFLSACIRDPASN